MPDQRISHVTFIFCTTGVISSKNVNFQVELKLHTQLIVGQAETEILCVSPKIPHYLHCIKSSINAETSGSRQDSKASNHWTFQAMRSSSINIFTTGGTKTSAANQTLHGAIMMLMQ